MQTIIAAGLSGLSLGTQYALIAVGFTLIFGIMGVINFAHGGLYVLGGYIAYSLIVGLGMPFAVAVVLAAIGTAIVGYLIEVLVVHKHVQDHLSTMLITLGIYLMLTTGLKHFYGAEAVTFSFPITGGVRWGGLYLSYPSMIVTVICVVAIISVYWLVFKTRYGIALRAMADNTDVATAQGIRPKQMFPMAFALASGLAGLTGALVAPLLSLEPYTGDHILGKAFVVVILGGLGSISGAVIASMLVGFIEAYASVYFGGSRGALILFVILMIVLLVRPQGLLGTVSRKA